MNWTKEDNKKDWLNDNIGTVHTFQGKEAKVVIYMLGCQSDGSANGAIKWVNANNVNVAFTRAKNMYMLLVMLLNGQNSIKILHLRKDTCLYIL